LVLMRVIRRNIEADPTRGEVWVRRWSLFLVLFIAGAAVVIDLIVLLTMFLQGEELTARFLLKVLVVLLVASAGFMHFMADIWGYWAKKPQYARSVNWATALLVVLTIAAGFLIIGSPASQRQLRLDDQRIMDLQSLQSQIVNYWQQKESLPADLSDLNDSLSYYSVPVDPATKTSYVYRRNSPLDFTLCATFATAGSEQRGRPMMEPAMYGMSDKWNHAAGEVCFDRSIDPELYPPFPKTR
jgi:hypothetical protein